MIAEIGAGLSSAKTLMDIAKGLNAANTQAQVNEVKIAPAREDHGRSPCSFRRQHGGGDERRTRKTA